MQNSKDYVIEEVQKDMEAGEKKIDELRIDLEGNLDSVTEDLKRKLYNFQQKQEQLSLTNESKFSKLKQEVKHLWSQIHKNNMMGTKALTNKASSLGIQDDSAGKELEQKVNAKLFILDTRIKEVEYEGNAKHSLVSNLLQKLVLTLQQAELKSMREEVSLPKIKVKKYNQQVSNIQSKKVESIQDSYRGNLEEMLAKDNSSIAILPH
mmetsp:Transcript_14911/g.14498  ORF Transcript_14911/g.14498 Transcript_14911/m.14498 type:complete len:208 (-) Transcript_14911:102-725(-)